MYIICTDSSYDQLDYSSLKKVVHREYSSEEQRFNSLQQRKRAAVSVADPTDYTKQSTLEESSEFTRRLTPEEILQLNQRRPLQSPSEGLKLFSFTKRHLKLPFSRGRNKRDRDKLISPEKEAHKFLTPSRQKKSLSTSARFTASERFDGIHNHILYVCISCTSCDSLIFPYRFKEVTSW